MNRDDLLDALDDLRHDLGKYIWMPVGMLPADAPEAMVREALHRALLETYRGPQGVRSAATLWASFLSECEVACAPWPDELMAMNDAMLAAMSWLERPLERQAMAADLRAVGEAIRALIRQVARDD